MENNNTPLERELAEAYKAMSEDEERENEAREWCETLIGDVLLEEPVSGNESKK